MSHMAFISLYYVIYEYSHTLIRSLERILATTYIDLINYVDCPISRATFN